jgi:hypothetical protein
MDWIEIFVPPLKSPGAFLKIGGSIFFNNFGLVLPPFQVKQIFFNLWRDSIQGVFEG